MRFSIHEGFDLSISLHKFHATGTGCCWAISRILTLHLVSLLEQLEDSNIASSTNNQLHNQKWQLWVHVQTSISTGDHCTRAVSKNQAKCDIMQVVYGSFGGVAWWGREREREKKRELKRVPTNTYNQLFIKGNPSITWGM